MSEETNRKLSAKEQKRLSAFEATCESYLQQGYKISYLTVGSVRRQWPWGLVESWSPWWGQDGGLYLEPWLDSPVVRR